MSFKKDFNSLFEIRKRHKSDTESFNIYSFKWIPVESLLSQIYIWFCIELCRYVGLKNSYKIRRNAKTCWKDSSAEMWNIIMLENIGVKNMQKGTITIDIFLLMNLAQFFGARVCWCLLAGKKASWESTDNSPRLELEPTCVAVKSQRQRGDEPCWAETPGCGQEWPCWLGLEGPRTWPWPC